MALLVTMAACAPGQPPPASPAPQTVTPPPPERRPITPLVSQSAPSVLGDRRKQASLLIDPTLVPAEFNDLYWRGPKRGYPDLAGDMKTYKSTDWWKEQPRHWSFIFTNDFLADQWRYSHASGSNTGDLFYDGSRPCTNPRGDHEYDTRAGWNACDNGLDERSPTPIPVMPYQTTLWPPENTPLEPIEGLPYLYFVASNFTDGEKVCWGEKDNYGTPTCDTLDPQGETGARPIYHTYPATSPSGAGTPNPWGLGPSWLPTIVQGEYQRWLNKRVISSDGHAAVETITQLCNFAVIASSLYSAAAADGIILSLDAGHALADIGSISYDAALQALQVYNYASAASSAYTAAHNEGAGLLCGTLFGWILSPFVNLQPTLEVSVRNLTHVPNDHLLTDLVALTPERKALHAKLSEYWKKQVNPKANAAIEGYGIRVHRAPEDPFTAPSDFYSYNPISDVQTAMYTELRGTSDASIAPTPPDIDTSLEDDLYHLYVENLSPRAANEFGKQTGPRLVCPGDTITAVQSLSNGYTKLEAIWTGPGTEVTQLITTKYLPRPMAAFHVAELGHHTVRFRATNEHIVTGCDRGTGICHYSTHESQTVSFEVGDPTYDGCPPAGSGIKPGADRRHSVAWSAVAVDYESKTEPDGAGGYRLAAIPHLNVLPEAEAEIRNNPQFWAPYWSWVRDRTSPFPLDLHREVNLDALRGKLVFEAFDLPAGYSLDPLTGWIAGPLPAPAGENDPARPLGTRVTVHIRDRHNYHLVDDGDYDYVASQELAFFDYNRPTGAVDRGSGTAVLSSTYTYAYGDAVSINPRVALVHGKLTFLLSTLSRLPLGLSLDAGTGTLSGKISLDEAASDLTAMIEATNGTVTLSAYVTFKLVSKPTIAYPFGGHATTQVGQPPIRLEPYVLYNTGWTITYVLDSTTPLPPGISFETATGAFFGSPLYGGSTHLKVHPYARLSDLTSAYDPLDAWIDVNGGRIHYSGMPDSALFIKEPGRLMPAVINGEAGAHFSIDDPTQLAADGLTLDPTTGVISGTPQKTDFFHHVTISYVDNATSRLGIPPDTTDVYISIYYHPPSWYYITSTNDVLWVYAGYDVSITPRLNISAGLQLHSWRDYGPIPGAAEGLPASLKVDPVTGTIKGTPAFSELGTYRVYINADASDRVYGTYGMTLLTVKVAYLIP